MSIQAIAWAFKQQIRPSALKFVLVSFANYANEYGDAWCSADTIQIITCLDKKTVVKWVRELERRGYIIDSGKREGKTGSIKVYKLVAFEHHPKTGVLPSSPKNASEAHPIIAGSSPNFGNPPAPPIENNLNKPKRTNISKKITLREWEAAYGGVLCIKQMASWVKTKNFDPKKIDVLIERFRISCVSGGNQYVDFVAAFQKWVNEGYFKIPLEDLQLPKGGDTKFKIFDKGVSL